ncbi:RimK family alpha-L-glutamate ligase [Paraburkholderia sediminicola]|uniref:ATP-grasp domain-containing protein n=1 Tax=Paraburkholderia sediminicola TaxID=458836 RepID=UPI0038BCC069
MTDAPRQAYQSLGLSVLLRAATAGDDLTPIGVSLLEYAQHHDDPDALLDLSLVLEMKYEKQAALAVQQQALQIRRLYRIRNASSENPSLKLLVLKAPGDLMANTPFECLLEHADLQIDVLYVDRHTTQEHGLPEHDVVLVAACALDKNAAALTRIAALLRETEKRVLNNPEGIAHTTRDAAYALLGGVPGICMARTTRVSRTQILDLLAGRSDDLFMLDVNYPLIIRPVESHAGDGLERVSSPAELADYADRSADAEFYIAPFIDYSSADGLFRKYRIVMVGMTPFLCHMGISAHWIVHYPYAEMIAHPERRGEEERLMSNFDTTFAVRHREALRAIVELTSLDYVGFDCAETEDGRLLIFEIATGMVVHDMDDAAFFPYKLPQMRRVFSAFHQMLVAAGTVRTTTTIKQECRSE